MERPGATSTISPSRTTTVPSNSASRVTMRPDKDGLVYQNEHGPSLRAVYDLRDAGRSVFMHSSGQSGLPCLEKPFDPADVRRVVGEVLAQDAL